MVVHARLSNSTFTLIFLLAGILILSPANAAPTADSVSFHYQNILLKDALNELIYDHGISIIYPDDLKNKLISAQCELCTAEEAIASLMSTSNLIWKKTGKQFTVLNSSLPFKYAVSGRALDQETGEPIPFANVFIPILQIGDITRNDGTFSIPSIPVRSCTLMISYIGFETLKMPLQFPAAEMEFHEVYLSPKILSTETVSITGENREFMDRSNSPGQISFSPRHVSTLPNLGEVDIFRSLQLLPGINLGLGGTSELYIRGGTPDQNLILLDGMPLYQMGHMFGFVSGVNANAIKDVQIYKGGFPSQYGGRVSSVIELTSRNGNSLKPHGSLYGNFMSQGITTGIPLFSRGSWILNVRRSTLTGYQTDLYNSIQSFVTGDDQFNLIEESADTNQSVNYIPQFSYKDLTSRISYMLSPNHRLTLTKTVGSDSIKENREFRGFKSIWSYDTTETKQRTERSTDGTTLNWSAHWNHEWDSRLTLAEYNYFSNYDSENSMNGSTIVGTSRERNQLKDNTIKFHHWYSGFENHKIESGIDESIYRFKFLVVTEDEGSSDKDSFKQNGFLHSFYVQDSWTPNRDYAFTSGLRFSYYSEKPGLFIAPRFSVIKKLGPVFTLESSIGRYFQFVHQLNSGLSTRGTQGMWMLSSNEIPVLSSTNLHIGLNWNYDDYSITTEVYHHSMENLTQFQDQTSIQRTHNGSMPTLFIGSGNSNGLEFLIRKISGRITGWVSYQFNKTIYQFPDILDGNSFLSDHDKTHELKTVMMSTFLGLDLTANWVFSSGRVYTKMDNIYHDKQTISILRERNGERLNPIHHLDISVSKLWNAKSVRLHSGISVYNVYNQNNTSHVRYNPYTTSLTTTDVTMFGITPTVFIQISF